VKKERVECSLPASGMDRPCSNAEQSARFKSRYGRKVMISGLVRRSVMRIGRSKERVTPPHVAMHAIARIDRPWGEPKVHLLPAVVQRRRLAIDVGAAVGGFRLFNNKNLRRRGS